MINWNCWIWDEEEEYKPGSQVELSKECKFLLPENKVSHQTVGSIAEWGCCPCSEEGCSSRSLRL